MPVVVNMTTRVARFGVPALFILGLDNKIEPIRPNSPNGIPYNPRSPPITTNTYLLRSPIEMKIVKVECLCLKIIEIPLHIFLDRGKIILMQDLISL